MTPLILMLLFAAGNPGRQEAPLTLTAAADLAGWVRSGAAEARLPPVRLGELSLLFDGDPETVMICGEEGLAVFTFIFPQPLPVTQLGVSLGGGGVYRWQAEAALAPPREREPSFKPLFSWRHVEGRKRDPVPIGGHREVTVLRITIERLTLGKEVVLRDINFYTTVELKILRLEDCPEKPRAGGTFPLKPVAIDRFGGRLALEEGVRWRSRPQGMVKIGAAGRCTPRHPGKARLGFSFGTLTSKDYTLHIQAPEPAPSDVTVTPYTTTAVVRFKGGNPACKAYAVYSRSQGAPLSQVPLRVTGGESCTVFGLGAGKVYLFSVAGLDEQGYPITLRSDEARVRTLPEGNEGIAPMANITLLTVIYTGGYSAEEIEALKRGFELARLFIFRNTGARLNLDIAYIELTGDLPEVNEPGLRILEEDLRSRGILIQSFDAVHGVSRNLPMNVSGYLFSNGAVGSAGASADAAYPGTDPGVDYRACWTLLHEFQHSLEFIISQGGGRSTMLSGHFLDNYPLPPGQVFDAGDFYDGQAEILRRFRGYRTLPPPWIGRIEVLDRDGDGLPDGDPRVPKDEARLGSDPANRDSDGDGLDDLREFIAGIYRGANPKIVDTDGDGLLDGADPFPLSRFSGRIPFGTPMRGEIPPGALSEGAYFSKLGDHSPPVKIHASWDRDFLYLAVESDRPLQVRIHLDGSGHLGRFESDRRVEAAAEGAGSGRAGSDVYTDDCCLSVSFGSSRLLIGERPVQEARVLSTENKGSRLIWVAIPASLGRGTARCHTREDSVSNRGLTLEKGRVLGLAFTLCDAGAAVEEFEGDWCSLFETHRFYDAVLVR